MPQRIFCISDIHGHFIQLTDLMDQLYKDHGLNLEEDILVTLGDNVDGGPDTKKVLDWSIDLKEKYPNNFISLFGNHESLLLDAFNEKHPIYGDFYLWYRQGGQATVDSFIAEDLDPYDRALINPKDVVTDKYLNFIRSLEPFYETEDYFFVHGGLYPHRSIEEHKEEFKKAYPTGFHPEFMREGDIVYDMIWQRDHIGDPYKWEKKLVFGHTFSYDFKPRVFDNMIGIDTMPHDEGCLTAVILPEEKFVFSAMAV